MAKPELGSKRACVSCSVRFYDLTRAPAVCPKCGTEQPVEAVRAVRARGIGLDRRLRKAEPAPAEAELESAEVQELDEEPDEAADDEDEAAAEVDEVDEEGLPAPPL